MLDAPVQRYLPAFRGAGKDRVTLRHLLTHSSGLPAWRPLYAETTTRAAALALVDTTPLTAEPGRTAGDSDLGAIVLTQVVENHLDVLTLLAVWRRTSSAKRANSQSTSGRGRRLRMPRRSRRMMRRMRRERCSR